MFNLSDALHVWDSVRDRFTRKNQNSKETGNLDVSFITPNLLAVGKLHDNNADELLATLQGQPALLWNLSGKEIPTPVRNKLNNQIVDFPWTTPGHFTQAPAIDCVLSLCYSIKSWLDLKKENVAILHCANGRSRTGILMACFLKYMGAFEHSSDAFDFFCANRVRDHVAPALSPSYRILFENVDRFVNHGGSPNPFPLHLKCLALAALPVDEIPCVEVWDVTGLVYNSHSGAQQNDNCKWSEFYGDGLYHTDVDVFGDFSIMCRFGGQHALTRDKSTLIFKYQNSTAFLPADVIELSKINVDINPEYSDSIDASTFSAHLMLETPSQAALQKIENQALTLIYQLKGKDAFEAGLDELSKYIGIEPDNQKAAALTAMNLPSQYIPIALQLTNNSKSKAKIIINQMIARVNELREEKHIRPALPQSPEHVKLNPGSLGISRSGLKAKRTLSTMALQNIDDLSKSLFVEGSAGGKVATLDANALVAAVGKSSSICAICCDDNYGKRDQLVPCTMCRRVYHTQCFGARRIPFTMKSVKERNNRDRYILKHYSSWICSTCQPKPSDTNNAPLPLMIPRRAPRNSTEDISDSTTKISNPTVGDSTEVESTSDIANDANKSPPTDGNGVVRSFSPIPRAESKNISDSATTKSNTDFADLSDVSNLLSFLNQNGMTIQDLINLKNNINKDETKANDAETPESTSSPNPSCVENLNNGQASATLLRGNSLTSKDVANSTDLTRTSSQVNSDSVSTVNDTIAGQSESTSQEHLPKTTGGTFTNLSDGKAVSVLLSAARLLELGQLDSRFFKYYKMTEVGLPISAIETKIKSDGLYELIPELITSNETVGVNSIQSNLAGGADYAGIGTNQSSGVGNAGTENSSNQIGGTGTETGSNQIGGSGFDGSGSNEIGGTGSAEKQTDIHNTSGSGNDGTGFGNAKGGTGSKLTSGVSNSVSDADIETFAKYIKMASVGLPPTAVANKMVTDGKCSTLESALAVLESFSRRNPGEGGDNIGIVSQGEGVTEGVTENKGMVQVQDHPKYSKYFKMLKLGLPSSSIKSKMEKEGVNPDFLDKLPTDMLELLPDPSEVLTNEDMIAIQDHLKYSKYFKMIKVGLAKEVVKSKMEQDGLDPNFLDKEPTSLIPKTEKLDGDTLAAQDHPTLSKFFKMLKVGLPKEAVKAKMQAEGVDAVFLDKQPTDMVPVQLEVSKPASIDSSANEGEKVPAGEHPKYSKFFKMIKVGLPKEAIKLKMQQEGCNPDVLDKDPAELIPLQDQPAPAKEEMVAAQEHPKYSKYFKMLKVGLAKEAVKAKMQQEGVDPTVLDKNPTDMIPLEEKKTTEMVAVQDHPKYTKFFKMLKVGLAKDAIKAKMQQEGCNPSYLDKEGSELVPLNDDAPPPPSPVKLKKSPAKPKIRKKKLHWKGLDASKVGGSLWAENDGEDDDFKLDEDEFDQLFVEKITKPGTETAVKAEPKKQRVHLIDMKRGQNGGIALARIKMSFAEVRQKISDMDDSTFSPDQLMSLDEYLATPDEARTLAAYKGSLDQLGPTEKYMMEMLALPTASKRIQCILFKQQFKPKLNEIRESINTLEQACDDVKMSPKLKKVLKTILRVGNQLNDGASHAGFTLDSLLKLQHAKAFDKKTSILQYVIKLIDRNDSSCLDFPSELSHVSEAARVQVDQIVADKESLLESHRKSVNMVKSLIQENSRDMSLAAMMEFLKKSSSQCDELCAEIDKLKEKFASALTYFGEDPAMSSIEFFSTLSQFIQAFIEEREAVERMKKLKPQAPLVVKDDSGTAIGSKEENKDEKQATESTSTGRPVQQVKRRNSSYM